MSTEKKKAKYLKDKQTLLDELNIKDNHLVMRHIKELYPNNTAIENYLRVVIFKNLGGE